MCRPSPCARRSAVRLKAPLEGADPAAGRHRPVAESRAWDRSGVVGCSSASRSSSRSPGRRAPRCSSAVEVAPNRPCRAPPATRPSEVAPGSPRRRRRTSTSTSTSTSTHLDDVDDDHHHCTGTAARAAEAAPGAVTVLRRRPRPSSIEAPPPPPPACDVGLQRRRRRHRGRGARGDERGSRRPRRACAGTTSSARLGTGVGIRRWPRARPLFHSDLGWAPGLDQLLDGRRERPRRSGQA